MALKDLAAPIVTVDGKPVFPSQVRADELPGQVPAITLEVPGTNPIEPGAAIRVTLPGGDPGPLEAAEVDDREMVGGTSSHLVARPPGARLFEETVSLCLREESRLALIRQLLAASDLSVGGLEGSDLPHARLTLLSEPRGPVVLRLALLGGRLVVAAGSGFVLVDPSSPAGVIPLPERGTTFRRLRRPVPALTLVAPDPTAWGEVIWHTTAEGSSARRRVLRLPEAVAEDELAVAASAIQSVERLGRFEASGGLALADVAPGSWVSTARHSPPILVTGRVRQWTPASGWQVTLLGGYPWDHLGAPQTCDSEPCQVDSYDEPTGLLKVRLPAHDDVVIDAGIRADRASAGELNAGIPAVGDRGTVLFGAGCDQALYIGATIPRGRLSKEQFEQIVDVIETPKLARRYRKDGKVQGECDRANQTYRSAWNVLSGTIDFKKA